LYSLQLHILAKSTRVSRYRVQFKTQIEDIPVVLLEREDLKSEVRKEMNLVLSTRLVFDIKYTGDHDSQEVFLHKTKQMSFI